MATRLQHVFHLFRSSQDATRLCAILSSRWPRLAATAGLVILLLLVGRNYERARPETDGLVHNDVDWSRFAYTQYVTNSEYLCNSVMLFDILHRLGSKADRVIMYPSEMVSPSATDDGRLLIKARDDYRVRLVPIAIQHRHSADNTWADSFTKLLAFNQTQYSRVLSLDSDAVIMQTMDELFLLPPCPVAMPRAYWLYPEKKMLSSQLMLVQPSSSEFQRIMEKVNGAKGSDYDMEIVNDLYQDSAMILPHRPYDLLTAEFRTDNHVNYLGSDREAWDPVAAYNEAKFIHFSDWPVPKPWIAMPEHVRAEKQPKCRNKDGVEQCVERDFWNGFYDDFRKRREVSSSSVVDISLLD
ncbi:hypothetical protein L249_1413 [Ophiocordyceps polyrhachis-furcata BCC 54312]|uniref:Glucose N-acetyltransferase 1 n=1 Tax=Ophiocordyceps polyrhachis-furcata BCC 54312 TaxID=1330021 RepID=A0A367L4H0_9HYPO|nr:hypothetical protein L249_1413 [Ophiocordyceps polyrhachis-furcata BCC 54312]